MSTYFECQKDCEIVESGKDCLEEECPHWGDCSLCAYNDSCSECDAGLNYYYKARGWK